MPELTVSGNVFCIAVGDLLLGRTARGHVPNGRYADAMGVSFGIVALDQ
jgi:hypothetical protein